MSKEISKIDRVEKLKKLLIDIHDGKDFAQIQKEFNQHFSGVSASEIAEAEKELVLNHGFEPSDITKLCDYHAALFEDSVDEPESAPASYIPTQIILDENAAIMQLIEGQVKANYDGYLNNETAATAELGRALTTLNDIGAHYQKKENIIFSYMEKHGITTPPKVMWAVDDEVRAMIKEALAEFNKNQDRAKTLDLIKGAIKGAEDMVTKENTILLPMILETFTDADWDKITVDFLKEDFYLINPKYVPQQNVQEDKSTILSEGEIKFPSGKLTITELTQILNTLPIDMTYVDKNDEVKYFSENSERLFPRARSVIGRNVSNCHPPASVHVVETLLEDFKSGAKDTEDFWINMRGKFILIRYFAVRASSGQYLGCLEVSQNLTPLKELSGEKRLLDE